MSKPAPEHGKSELWCAMFKDGVMLECEETKGNWIPVITAEIFDIPLPVRPAPITLDTKVTKWLEYAASSSHRHWFPFTDYIGKKIRECFADGVLRMGVCIRYKGCPQEPVLLTLPAEPSPEQESVKCLHCGEELTKYVKEGSWFHTDSKKFTCADRYAEPAPEQEVR